MHNNTIQTIYKQEDAKNKFAFWFAISFILNGYASGISGVSLGSACFVIMILITCLDIARSDVKIVVDPVVGFSSLFLFISLLGTFFYALQQNGTVSISGILMGTAKFLVWALMCTIVARKYFDTKQICKWIVRIGIVLTSYLIIQTIAFYVFSVYLPNIFDVAFLKPYGAGYADYERLAAVAIYRPAAFLSESSFYGNYALCAFILYFEVNIKSIGSKQIMLGLFFSLGILLSGSTSAIVMLLVVWFVELHRLKANVRVLIFVLFLLFISIAFSTGWLAKMLSSSGIGQSLIYAFNKFTYMDESSRVGKSFAYLELIAPVNLLFGLGIGNETRVLKSIVRTEGIYLNSATSLILQGGYISLALFLIMVIALLRTAMRQKNVPVILLMAIYTIKGFASGIYFSTYGVLFMFLTTGLLMEKRGKTEIVR